MRFSLRTFLIIFSILAIACGWFGARYIKSKKEQQLLADLSPGVYSYDFLVRSHRTPDDLYLRYDSDRMFALADKYSKIAEDEPSDSVSARIATAALCHYGSRYDVAQKKFICGPKTIEFAEKYYDSKIEPLASASTAILMRHHRFVDNGIGQSQRCRAKFEDGFDADDPSDILVLTAEIYVEFDLCGGAYEVVEAWPIPNHPWDWDLDDSASHTYDDKVAALKQVSPKAADAYARILSVVRECDGNPSNAQYQKLSDLSREVQLALDKWAVFRFLLKNKALFKLDPSLLRPPLPGSQSPSEAHDKPEKE